MEYRPFILDVLFSLTIFLIGRNSLLTCLRQCTNSNQYNLSISFNDRNNCLHSIDICIIFSCHFRSYT